MHLRHLCIVFAAAVALAACSSESDPAPPPYDGEPNDSLALATPITAGAPFGAAIASYVDVDYYRFAVPAGGGHVRVQTFDASGSACDTIDTYTELYSAGGTQLAQDDDSGPGYCGDLYVWEPEGTYYAAIWGGYAPEAFPYTVLVTVTSVGPGSAEVEPNGSIGTATGPFTGDALVSGSISTSGEYDYYAISNSTASARTVYLETFTGALRSCSWDTTVALYNGSGTQLAYNDDSGVNACSLLSYSIPAYTTYYARVGSYYYGDTFSYLLEVDFL